MVLPRLGQCESNPERASGLPVSTRNVSNRCSHQALVIPGDNGLARCPQESSIVTPTAPPSLARLRRGQRTHASREDNRAQEVGSERCEAARRRRRALSTKTCAPRRLPALETQLVAFLYVLPI